MKRGMLYVFMLSLSGWLAAQDITYRVVERSPYRYTDCGCIYIDYKLNDFENDCAYVEPGTIVKYDAKKNYYYADFAFGRTAPKDM